MEFKPKLGFYFSAKELERSDLNEFGQKFLKPDDTRAGICPECKEHTTVANSCCGYGAIVDGKLCPDDELEELV